MFYRKQTLGLTHSFIQQTFFVFLLRVKYELGAEDTPGKYKITKNSAFKESQSLRRDSSLKFHFYFWWLDPS